MTDEEVDEFLESALTELSLKQDRLRADYGIGKFARWQFDQKTAKLTFFDERGEKRLAADVIDIGSYSYRSKSWKWAWANESVLPKLREKAEPLKELSAITGIAIFAEKHAFPIEDENMAYDLVALSARHLGALGVYQAPSSTRPLAAFLAIMDISQC